MQVDIDSFHRQADAQNRQLQLQLLDDAKASLKVWMDVCWKQSVALPGIVLQFTKGAITSGELQRHVMAFSFTLNEISITEQVVYEMETRLRS